MTQSRKTAGYFTNGVPYNRLGHGPRILVVFQGLEDVLSFLLEG